MNTTLAYLRGRRAWTVEGLRVWGTENEADIYLAAMETIGSDKKIGLWHIALGGYRQEMTFADLIDNRGNNLPETIKKPAVVVIPRSNKSAYIKSITGETGFVIAKCDDDSTSATVDLLIFEVGL